MTLASSVKLLSPEEILTRSDEEIPFLRLPDTGQVFADRSLRLRQLAANHAMRDYLLFVADMATAQHEALQLAQTLVLPDQAQIRHAARGGLPLLPPADWKRSPQWQDDLVFILDKLLTHLPDGQTRAVVQSLKAQSPTTTELQADRLLTGVMLGLDLATAPLLAAALQVHWVRLVTQIQATYPDAAFGRIDNGTICPCCGSKPTASISRIGAKESGARYMHCCLCQTQWHMVRIKCARCEDSKSISYRELDPLEGIDVAPTGAPRGTVRAECCDACGHYSKVVYMDKDAYVEPVADDLASLTLDLLTADSGMLRHGVNLMLLFGDGGEAQDAALSEPGSKHGDG